MSPRLPPRCSTTLFRTVSRILERSRVSTLNPYLLGNAKILNQQSVEDYRPGYPRFAALIGAHPPFHISRRFSQLRSRLLLLKQDELSVLEANLEAIDQEEAKELYLGNSRRDKNPVRKKILDDIDSALRQYGMRPDKSTPVR